MEILKSRYNLKRESERDGPYGMKRIGKARHFDTISKPSIVAATIAMTLTAILHADRRSYLTVSTLDMLIASTHKS